MKGPGKGKTNNPKGKPKGALNRTTKESKELLEQVLLGQVDNINSALIKVLKDDPAKYLDACSKLFNYVLPKRTDVTSGEKEIPTSLPVIIIQ